MKSRAVIREKNLVVCSGAERHRNFEGRIQQTRANYLASPPLVVRVALAGWITKDLTTEPLGEDPRPAGVPQGHLAHRAGTAETMLLRHL